MMENKEGLQLLSDLVSIKSHSSEEQEVSDFIRDWCKTEHIPFQIVEGNVVITLGNENNKKHLVLNAHMDVVSENNWKNPLNLQQDAFEPIIIGRRMYGRGCVDTKSGLAAMLQTAHELVRNPDLIAGLNGQVSFILSRAEEAMASFNGVRKVLESNVIPTPTAAIIAEPSNLEILLGSGGIFSFSLEGNATSSEIHDSSVLNTGLLMESAARVKEELPVIDRLLLFQFMLNSVWKNETVIHEITCSSEGFAFRPERLAIKISGDLDEKALLAWANRIDEQGLLIFETSNPELIGHPAYANYHPKTMKLVADVFGDNYLPFTNTVFEAINLMIFRSKQKLRTGISHQEAIFAPLPNFEFTCLTLKNGTYRINVSSRTSPEVDNVCVRDFITKASSKLTVTSAPYRNAIYTDKDAEIATISGRAVQPYFGVQTPFAVQLGASDGQVMRDIHPTLPIILLSAGSGVITQSGSVDQAPKYLSTSHQPDEFVDLGQFEVLPRIYLQIILEYLR